MHPEPVAPQQMETSPPDPADRMRRPLGAPAAALAYAALLAAVAGLARLWHGSWARAGMASLAPAALSVAALALWYVERRRGRALPARLAVPLLAGSGALAGGAASCLFPALGPVRAGVVMGVIWGALLCVRWVRGSRPARGGASPLLLLLLSLPAAPLGAQAAQAAKATQPSPPATIAGSWRGTSLCTERVKPRCHDEVVVYHLRALDAPAARDTLRLEWVMNKVVAGKEEDMATLACSYVPATGEATCPMGTGVWRFRAAGAEMVGTLTASDGRLLYRNIRVTRAER